MLNDTWPNDILKNYIQQNDTWHNDILSKLTYLRFPLHKMTQGNVIMVNMTFGKMTLASMPSDISAKQHWEK